MNYPVLNWQNDSLDKEIRAYDPLPKSEETSLPFGGRVVQSYGEYLEDHLSWTSETLKQFLGFLGYDERVADRVAQAFKRHDIGKAGMPGEWKLTEGKQNLSEEDKLRRTKEHCLLGAERINKAMEQLAPDRTANETIGFEIAEYMALLHHERLNGTGPFGRTGADMCPILRAATIVDTFHGKLKAGKNPDQICQEMASGKLEAEFDQEMLSRFCSYLKKSAPDMRVGMILQP